MQILADDDKIGIGKMKCHSVPSFSSLVCKFLKLGLKGVSIFFFLNCYMILMDIVHFFFMVFDN